ncbi:hypothetical protein PHMEG_00040551 [Phytophthora megakarya]|uniref:RxLR effector protein n=1 Tax=Phytophthora megakarya TaxID=4795 RepID=A0A225UEK8_9STRA|nr:hypothetical protein PHMEG_00040551 [Phytophthora megakarya]
MTDESDSEQRTGVGQIVNSVKSWTKNTRLSQLIKSKFISQEAKAKALIQRGATNEALYKEKIIPENVYKALGYEDDMPYAGFLNLDDDGKYRFTMRRMKDPEEFRKYQQFQTYEIEWHQAILNKRLPNKK